MAYLDDGTMVVVDNARKMIGKNIDVSVTSVLQTTAGKMIFGKFDERAMYIAAPRRTATGHSQIRVPSRCGTGHGNAKAGIVLMEDFRLDLPQGSPLFELRRSRAYTALPA